MKQLIPLILSLAIILGACASGGAQPPASSASSDTGAASAPAESSSDAGSAQAEYTMTLALHTAADSVQNKAFMAFADEVAEKSGGKIAINLSPGGALGSQREIVEAVNLGTIEMGMGESGIYSNYNSAWGVLAMPFLYNSEEAFFKVLDSEVGEKLEALLQESTDMVMLGWLYGGKRDVYSSTELTSLDGLNGLKIRTPESSVFVEGFKALSANPTPVAATEMYAAIQQGTVQAMEGSQETAYTYKIYEVAKNCLETGHIYTDVSLVINKGVFEKLPEELKQVLMEAGDNLTVNCRTLWSESAEKYKDMMVAEGMVFTPVDVAPAKEAVSGFYTTYINGDATMQELFDKIVAMQ